MYAVSHEAALEAVYLNARLIAHDLAELAQLQLHAICEEDNYLFLRYRPR